MKQAGNCTFGFGFMGEGLNVVTRPVFNRCQVEALNSCQYKKDKNDMAQSNFEMRVYLDSTLFGLDYAFFSTLCTDTVPQVKIY